MPASVEKITIALPPKMVASVRKAVDAGDYASSSEVVRDALRDWRQKRQARQSGLKELRRMWREARADKSAGLDPDEVFDELERKYQTIAQAAGGARECATFWPRRSSVIWKKSRSGPCRMTLRGQ
jgi:antitoxin ParD1/3/4